MAKNWRKVPGWITRPQVPDEPDYGALFGTGGFLSGRHFNFPGVIPLKGSFLGPLGSQLGRGVFSPGGWGPFFLFGETPHFFTGVEPIVL